MNTLKLRGYVSRQDLQALCRLYRLSIWQLAKHHYPLEACRAWANWSSNEALVDQLLRKGQTAIAEWDGELAGFAQRYPAGHVNMLYVAPEKARRGVASTLLTFLERGAREQAVAELTTHASRVSRPLFEKAGYRLLRSEATQRDGIQIERFLMQKNLFCLD